MASALWMWGRDSFRMSVKDTGCAISLCSPWLVDGSLSFAPACIDSFLDLLSPGLVDGGRVSWSVEALPATHSAEFSNPGFTS